MLCPLQAMRASPYIKPLEAQASHWELLLTTLQDMLDNWLTCQATWQYLEPIFSSPDILKQMPEEGEKFQVRRASQVLQLLKGMLAAVGPGSGSANSCPSLGACHASRQTPWRNAAK